LNGKCRLLPLVMCLFIFKGIIMDSPLEKFIEWYMSLPVPHRQSIVEFVIFFNIGFDDIDTANMKSLSRSDCTACDYI
jgi:hypothetical protein